MLQSGSSVWRSFRLCRIPWIVLIAAGPLDCATLVAAQRPPEKFSRAVLIRFQDVITPGLQQYLQRKLRVAKAKDADLLVIEIDSPGGMLEPSKAIAERLRDLKWAHTVAYIPREALSGAAFVALGCDEIIMGPHARIGDAGPIYLDEGFMFRHAPEKIRSDLAAVVRGLAEAKGRPPALVEAMVDKDLEVFRVRSRTTGKETCMSQHEIDASDNPDDWENPRPILESTGDNFLEVNGTRAVELGLADGIAGSRDELRARYRPTDGLMVIEPGAVDTAVAILNHPVATGLLILVGMVAIYIEFSAAGIGLGGLTAALCFAVFFWSRFLGGTADWLEVILFAAGIVFLLVELFVLPGFGVAGVTGFILLILSLIMASHSFVIPEKSWQFSQMAQTLLVLMISGGVFLGTAVAMSKYFGDIPLLGRIALRPPDATDMAANPTAGVVGHVSRHFGVELEDRGIADSPLRPAGRARFGDNYIDVMTEGAFVDKGAPVKVIQVSGNRVVVRKVEEA